jgi:AcrR family transcriptional regulator
MSTQTAEWTVPHPPGTGVPPAEGLRERKKRLMRQKLSDTATQMFLEQGFDAVRVTEIAEACGVSEKTVFNYFPTKESLILDRLEATVASLRTGLAESGEPGKSGIPPVQAALRILDDELGAMTSWLAAQDDPLQAGVMVRRFGALIQATPSLRAHQSDMMDQFTAVAAEILAERAGLSPEDPEPQITATALLGLWRIQFQALSRYLDGTRTPAQVHQAVTADVRRAAQLINTGLNSLTAAAPGPERHQDTPATTATEHAPRLTVRFSRVGWFGGSGGCRGGRRCFRRRGWGWCEPGRGDVCHHDRHDHQRHDGHGV